MYYVYILLSKKDNKLYIGCTNNLIKRLGQHNSKKVESTKSRAPFKLIYYEAYINEKNAFRREKFYKSGRGHEVIQRVLKETLENLDKAR